MVQNHIRKTVSAAVAALAVFGLAACGGSGGSNSAKVTKITLFESMVEVANQVKAMAKEYQKETGVTVEVWGTTGDNYISVLKTKLANKITGPTIFQSSGGQEGETMKSYMADLSNAPFVKDIAKGADFSINGKTLGLPVSVQSYGLIVNTNLVDPAKVTTQNGFIDMLKQAKAKGRYTGFELSQESYFLIGHMLNTAFSMQKDPKQFVADVVSGKVKLQDIKEFQDLAKVYEAIRQYTNNPLPITYDKEIGDLMTGKTASLNQGTWINTMLLSYKNSAAKLKLLPFPLSDNTKMVVGVPEYWHVNGLKSKSEQQAGIDFLNWMVSSKTGQDYIVNKMSFLPAMTNIKVDESKLDPLSLATYKDIQSGRDNLPWAYQYWPASIADTHLRGTAQAFFTDKTMTGLQFISQINDDFVTTGTKK